MGFNRETRTLPHIDPKGPTYIHPIRPDTKPKEKKYQCQNITPCPASGSSIWLDSRGRFLQQYLVGLEMLLV